MRKEYTPIRRAYAVIGFVTMIAGTLAIIAGLAYVANARMQAIKEMPLEYCDAESGECRSAVEIYQATN